MSFEITTAFVEEYKSTITMLSQQKGSKLRSCVRNEDVTGENAYFEQIGAVEAEDILDRHGDSPIMHTPHRRRRVNPIDSDWGDLVDKLDKVKMLTDPTSSYTKAGAWALGRKYDDRVIEAATGTAYTGKNGTVAVPLPASQIIPVNYSGSNEGLTVNKVIATKSLFGVNEVDEEDPMNELFFTISQVQLDDLLKTTQVTSSDYNSVKALVKGDIDAWMGFQWKRTQRLLHDATTDIRTCFAHARSGICAGIGQDIQGEIAKRPDKRFAWYVYACMSIGASRMEEKKVVSVLCDESP